MNKQTSDRVSSIAAGILDEEPVTGNRTVTADACNSLLAHAKTFAGSCLSQDETPGPRPANFLDRLRIEREDLNARLTKLTAFLETPTPDLSGHQRELLFVQASAMRSYLAVLDMRITDLSTTKLGRTVASSGKAELPTEIGEPVEVGGHDEDRDGPIPFGH